MNIRNSKRWSTAGPEGYLAGIAGVCVAFALRYILHPVVEGHIPMLFFAINCIVIAFIYGFWPSFWMLLVSMPLAFYFFVEPINSFGPFIEKRDVFLFIVYSSLVGLTGIMFELLHRAKYNSALHVLVSETRYRLLVEADEDRRNAPPRIRAT
jgi:K+-sensing histidine kinase KdpD